MVDLTEITVLQISSWKQTIHADMDDDFFLHNDKPGFKLVVNAIVYRQRVRPGDKLGNITRSKIVESRSQKRELSMASSKRKMDIQPSDFLYLFTTQHLKPTKIIYLEQNEIICL